MGPVLVRPGGLSIFSHTNDTKVTEKIGTETFWHRVYPGDKEKWSVIAHLSRYLPKNAMSDQQPDEEFWNLADQFVGLANQTSEVASRGKVSAAMLFAAARFNTFVMASTVRGPEEFTARKQEAIAYYVGQFEKMLRENLDDYEVNFSRYVAKDGQ